MNTTILTSNTLPADLDLAAGPLDPSRPVVIVAGDTRQTLAAGWSADDMTGAMEAVFAAAGTAPRVGHLRDRVCDEITIDAIDGEPTRGPIALPATVALLPLAPALPAPAAAEVAQPDLVIPAPHDPAVRLALAHGSAGYSEAADARIAAQERLADDLGFRLPPPLYRRGMLLRDGGAARVEALRKEWSDMPAVADAVAAFKRVIEGEQREDVPVDIGAARFNDDGTVLTTPRGVFTCEADGWPTLANRLATVADVPLIGAALAKYAGPLAPMRGDYLRKLQAEINRDHDVESVLAREAERKVPAAPAMKLRTRVSATGLGRQVYAVTSTRYTSFDVDRVAQVVADMVAEDGGDYRAEIDYDGRSARINVVTFTDVDGVDAAAGEVYKAGFTLIADDVGDGGIAAEAEVWRNRCLNFIIVKASRVRVESLQHRGEITELTAKVRKAVAAAMAKIKPFAAMWNRAQVAPLAAEIDVRRAAGDPLADAIAAWQRQAAAERTADHLAWGRDLMAGVFRGLAREYALVPARTIEAAIPLMVAAHDDDRNAGRAREAGPTRASIVNALTLFAQGQDPARELTIERAAGTILASPSPLPYALAEATA